MTLLWQSFNSSFIFKEQRAKYNKEHYIQVFASEEIAGHLKTSEAEPSLCDLVQRYIHLEILRLVWNQFLKL